MMDHSMKMKHSDMPMQQKILLPIRNPTPVVGSVAENLRNFIKSNSTDALTQANSCNSADQVAKSQDARQKQKQVAFDIRAGIKDLIKDSGIDLN